VVDKKIRELYAVPTTCYIRLVYYRPAQIYIIYILISLELYMDMWIITSDIYVNLGLNTKALLPLLPVLTAGNYIVIST